MAVPSNTAYSGADCATCGEPAETTSCQRPDASI